MVFNSAWVATVATLSAELCQYIACNPQRLPAGEVLRLLCYAPLHLAGRLAAGVFSFFCFPIAAPPSPFLHRWPSSSSPSSSSSSSSYSGDEDFHSD
ncbi:unnamed protein product [Spirodela intermedia]|uniref:Uncharacterized protein n=1 Tax=Spirodela intermedia TaxID=51605 RepID=A0A7I8JXJ4_SPIIN|nr:unnamed protein product [Spirodela intermedia]